MTTPLTGSEVRTRREALGLTLGELARRANVFVAELTDWEGGGWVPYPAPRDRITAAILAAEASSPPSPAETPGIGPVGAPASGEGLCGAKLTDGFGMTVFCGRHPHDRSLKHRSGEPPSVTEWVDPAGAEDVDRAQVAALGAERETARPGEWFVEGLESHDGATKRPENPHPNGTDAATWWGRGYSYAQRLWRAQCAERERDEARDDTGRMAAELGEVSEVLAPVLGDFGGGCDTAEGHARRARDLILEWGAGRAQGAALGSVEPGSWRDIMARTTAELAAIAAALPEGEGTLPERVARVAQVARDCEEGERVACRERDEARQGWDAWIVAALADLGAEHAEDFRSACIRLRTRVEDLETADGAMAAAFGATRRALGVDHPATHAEIVQAAQASRDTAAELLRLLEEARADRAQLADDAAEWRSYRAAADARTDPGAADTVEAIAKACGMVKDEYGDWGTNDGAGVWHDDDGWNWDAGYAHHYGVATELDALRAYAAATGVTLPTPAQVPTPTPPRNPWPGAAGGSARPAHYGMEPEPLAVIVAWGLPFPEGSILKYVARLGRKAGTTRLADLRKIRDLADRLIGFEGVQS